MRILILGGTSFVGRTVVSEAQRTGLDLSLFNRGRSGTGLFRGLPRKLLSEA